MTLGEKIHELRKAHKMSQERVAELLGVSRQAVSKWETCQSRPNTENLICLAEIFNVSVEELTNPDTKVALVYDLREELNHSSSFNFFNSLVSTRYISMYPHSGHTATLTSPIVVALSFLFIDTTIP